MTLFLPLQDRAAAWCPHYCPIVTHAHRNDTLFLNLSNFKNRRKDHKQRNCRFNSLQGFYQDSFLFLLQTILIFCYQMSRRKRL